jgi:hypothetical protein
LRSFCRNEEVKEKNLVMIEDLCTRWSFVIIWYEEYACYTYELIRFLELQNILSFGGKYDFRSLYRYIPADIAPIENVDRVFNACDVGFDYFTPGIPGYLESCRWYSGRFSTILDIFWIMFPSWLRKRRKSSEEDNDEVLPDYGLRVACSCIQILKEMHQSKVFAWSHEQDTCPRLLLCRIDYWENFAKIQWPFCGSTLLRRVYAILSNVFVETNVIFVSGICALSRRL